MFAILYSTRIGDSFHMLKVTVFDKVVAFVNKCMYRTFNINDTALFISITVALSYNNTEEQFKFRTSRQQNQIRPHNRTTCSDRAT